MAKLPYMQFYPADYLRDTRCLSMASRGAWMDILCALWNAPKRGIKTLTLDGWAGELGKPSAEVSLYLMDLKGHGIAKIIYKKDEKICIISRRMVRDERVRKCAAKRQQKQRKEAESRQESRPCHSDVTGIYQNHSHISESYLIREEGIKKDRSADRRRALEEFSVTEKIRGWALEKFNVEIPDDVVTEFKDHWRKEPDKKLRLDWNATFQGRIRQLVNWGTLKPNPTAQPRHVVGHMKVVL